MRHERPHIHTQSRTDVINLYHSNQSVKMHAMHRCVQTKSAQRKYWVQLHCSMLWCNRQQGLKPFTLLVLFGPMELVQKNKQL